jgi:hypothetical protein
VEVQQDYSVGEAWNLPQVDHKKAHDTWFSRSGLTWGITPKPEDFPEYTQYKTEYDEFIASLEEEDLPHEEFQRKLDGWLIKNKYLPEGFKESCDELSKEVFEKFKETYNVQENESGALIIKDAKTAHALQQVNKQVNEVVDSKYKQMFEEQGCRDIPEDPKVIGKDLRFKIVAVKDDVEYMECVSASGACTSKPPGVLRMGGGIAIFLGWIEPGQTQIRYYEAYPIWNGNGKYSQDKVVKAIKRICYSMFPENMAPLFKALIKKAGFKLSKV